MKKILIPGWSLGDNSWGVTKTYLHYLSQFGQVEIITPKQGIVDGDLLVLPGGADINPSSYNQIPGFKTGNTDVYKQFFFENNLKYYVKSDIPIFGICLGMQQLNVFFGGSLTQDYPFVYSGCRDSLVEELEFNPQSVVSKPLKYKVNSLHHQGVFESDLAPSLSADAISTVHKNIEILSHKTKNIFGVQYHPEEINCQVANNIIINLLNK